MHFSPQSLLLCAFESLEFVAYAFESLEFVAYTFESIEFILTYKRGSFEIGCLVNYELIKIHGHKNRAGHEALNLVF